MNGRKGTVEGQQSVRREQPGVRVVAGGDRLLVLYPTKPPSRVPPRPQLHAACHRTQSRRPSQGRQLPIPHPLRSRKHRWDNSEASRALLDLQIVPTDQLTSCRRTKGDSPPDKSAFLTRNLLPRIRFDAVRVLFAQHPRMSKRDQLSVHKTRQGIGRPLAVRFDVANTPDR